jgi:hypothetical protein
MKDRRRNGSDGKTRKKRKKNKQLLNCRKKRRGLWKLKQNSLYRKLWGTRFGIGYGPVVRETAVWRKRKIENKSSIPEVSARCLETDFDTKNAFPTICFAYSCSTLTALHPLVWKTVWIHVVCFSRIQLYMDVSYITFCRNVMRQHALTGVIWPYLL